MTAGTPAGPPRRGPRAPDPRKSWAAGALGAPFLSALLSTVRFETSGEENYRRYWDRGEPVVFVLWHGRLLPCTYHHRHQRVVTLISQHRDGEYIARVVERWGYTAARGSSTRGGTSALRQLVRYVRGGRSLAITPDGPRGPRERMKPGALLAAQVSGAPVIPVAADASRAWRFGSWDRFLLPKPFSRVRIAYGAPILVPRDGGEEALERAAREAEASLGELMVQVAGEVVS